MFGIDDQAYLVEHIEDYRRKQNLKRDGEMIILRRRRDGLMFTKTFRLISGAVHIDFRRNNVAEWHKH